ncbi:MULTISPECIES: hypothetical protein [Pseudosulfitobacter]|uniref:hypothetical protein n=1 Tax=Pseudosulfitobacter pseudonitzschiae TaxID=1402135 RepID=UPI00138E2AB5|nr:hypothetical protein [Pseudosulfitobacter pseudonitzschiae]QKS06976.1 hypothetical protein HT745_15885 [Pseudosulfitobacter pseudonitzschiae]
MLISQPSRRNVALCDDDRAQPPDQSADSVLKKCLEEIADPTWSGKQGRWAGLAHRLCAALALRFSAAQYPEFLAFHPILQFINYCDVIRKKY